MTSRNSGMRSTFVSVPPITLIPTATGINTQATVVKSSLIRSTNDRSLRSLNGSAVSCLAIVDLPAVGPRPDVPR
jgi:hypothetical protein